MTIELFDSNAPYVVQTTDDKEGKYYIRIFPNSSADNIDEDYEIRLYKEDALQLSRLLNFLANEIG